MPFQKCGSGKASLIRWHLSGDLKEVRARLNKQLEVVCQRVRTGNEQGAVCTAGVPNVVLGWSPFPIRLPRRKQHFLWDLKKTCMTVMVNFSFVKWPRSQDAQTFSHIILGMSLRVFLGEMNIEAVNWVKQAAIPNVGGPHPIRWRPKQSKN